MAESTKRTAKKTTARRSTKAEAATPVNAHLDNALFPPRLDLLALPEAMMEGAGPSYGDMLESICGVDDDSQEVELYNGTLGVTATFVAAHQKPVAQVQWNANLGTVFTNPGNVNGVRWGSGTMIGPDLFLTCGHLFDADPNGWTIPRQNGTATPITPQQVATNMHLNFLFQLDENGVQRPEQSFPITQLIEYRLGGLDMALCRIGGNPGNTFGWSEFATTNSAVGDMLAIIGHPLGQPKRIEAGPCTELTGSVIRYNDIDTLGGNSGSGILHASTGRVVGVHTNGGCNPQGTGSNSGVAIAAIVAASPTLQATTPSSRTAKGEDLVLTTSLAKDVFQTTRATDAIATIRSFDTAAAADFATTLASDFGTTRLRDTATAFLADNPIGTGFGDDDPVNTLREGVIDPGDFDPVGPIALGGLLQTFVQATQFRNVGQENIETSTAEALAELDAAITAQEAVLESMLAARAALTEQAAEA